jgi:hypothetical protein
MLMPQMALAKSRYLRAVAKIAEALCPDTAIFVSEWTEPSDRANYQRAVWRSTRPASTLSAEIRSALDVIAYADNRELVMKIFIKG